MSITFFPIGQGQGECGCELAGFMPREGIHLPLNHFTSDVPPNQYPLGMSQMTVGGPDSLFPFNGSVKAFRYQDGRVEQYGATLTGARWFRVGSDIAWAGGGDGWIQQPTLNTAVMSLSQFDPDVSNPDTIYFLTGDS